MPRGPFSSCRYHMRTNFWARRGGRLGAESAVCSARCDRVRGLLPRGGVQESELLGASRCSARCGREERGFSAARGGRLGAGKRVTSLALPLGGVQESEFLGGSARGLASGRCRGCRQPDPARSDNLPPLPQRRRTGAPTHRSARRPSERGPRRGPATFGFWYSPRGTNPARRRWRTCSTKSGKPSPTHSRRIHERAILNSATARSSCSS